MQAFLNSIPKELINFLLVSVFSLLIGLSQRKLHQMVDEKHVFGTDRTFAFIGILGFILYVIEPSNHYFYAGGGMALVFLLGINYYFKLLTFQRFGLTTIMIALITYCLAPIVITQPSWLTLTIVVAVLILTELKDTFMIFTDKLDKEEFVTLAKFLVIIGIILPIIPNERIIPEISLTPYRIWLAVVVISSISYFSYLLRKFVFHDSGIIVSGILGGLYSSTATTVILSRKSKTSNEKDLNKYAAAIIFATAMMYLRIFIIILIFNASLFSRTMPYFIIMFLITTGIGIFLMYTKKKDEAEDTTQIVNDKNPLEFKVALIFTLLFIAFSFITYYTIKNFGTGGLNVLSVLVGVTDIDPFLINLFQGKYEVAETIIALATFQAIISNNFLKMIYSISFSEKTIRKKMIISFGIIIVINILLLFFI
ncbi:MAG: DUF4010 domain-containing protein [Bacteroidota bacterium]